MISTVLSAVDLGIIFGGRRVKPRIARILQQSRIPRSVLMIYILASTSRGFTMYMANVLTRKGLPDTAPTILTLGLFKMKCRKTGSLAQDPYRQANRSRLRNHEPHPVAALLVDTCRNRDPLKRAACHRYTKVWVMLPHKSFRLVNGVTRLDLNTLNLGLREALRPPRLAAPTERSQSRSR